MNKFSMLKWCLLIASTATVMAGVTVAPVLPAMQAQFSFMERSELLVQLCFVAPSLSIILFSPFIGARLHLLKSQHLMVAGLLLFGGSGSVGYFTDSLWVIIISRLLLGIAVATIMTLVIKLIGDAFPPAQRAGVMGLMAAFGAFGGVLFTALAVELGSYSWRIPFLIHLLPCFFIPLLYWVLAGSDYRESGLGGSVPTTTEKSANGPSSIKPAVEAEGLKPFFWLAIAEMLLLYSIPLYLLFYLQESSFYDVNSNSGWLISLFLLCLAVASTSYGKLKPQFSFLQLHILGYGLACIGLVGLFIGLSEFAIVASLVISGAGFGFVRPNLVAWLMNHCAPKDRGGASGKLVSGYFIGQVVSPLVYAPIVGLVSYQGAYILGALGALCVSVLPMILFMRQREFLVGQSEAPANSN